MGVDIFYPEDNLFVSFHPYSLSDNTVTALYEDDSGYIWIGTDGGNLAKYDRENETLTFFHSYSFSGSAITSIYQDQFGLLWIGTDGGLDKFDLNAEAIIHYQKDPEDYYSLSNNYITSIIEDQIGNLWIGTNGAGLNRFDRDNEIFLPYLRETENPNSLSSNIVLSILEDHEGVLWVGTNGGGLHKSNVGKTNFLHYKNDLGNPVSLSNNMVLSIYQDQFGILWVGTDGGLNKSDGERMNFTRYHTNSDNTYSISDDYIRAIFEDQYGYLWIGTNNGLDRFDRDIEEFINFRNTRSDPESLSSNFVTSIIEDRSGLIWIGTTNGLNSFSRSNGKFEQYFTEIENPKSLSNNFIRVIYEDQDDYLWIGTADGLNTYDKNNRTFTRYLNDPIAHNSLSDNHILSIYQDDSGNLWIGTIGGLNRYKTDTDSFLQYREKDGLPSDVINGILEDDLGNLWLSTNHGLSRFNLETETFQNYDLRDGLQSNEFNAGAFYKSSDGQMYFGGINGFNAFSPVKIVTNPNIPIIELTSITQGGEEIKLNRPIENMEEISFEWPDNYFEFEFAALSYMQPEKNQYAYILEELDDDWNNIGNKRFGRYTNLPGGTYTLRIIGSNNDGVWNDEGITLTVNIIPPFWATWWFRSVIAFLFIAGILGGIRYRVKRAEARSLNLENQVRDRTIELSQTNERLKAEIAERQRIEGELAKQAVDTAVTAERNRLARDLHDAVTQTLFSASLLAEALPETWKKNTSEGRRILKELRQLSRGALAEMRTLLFELRPKSLEEAKLKDLLNQLAEAATAQEGLPIDVQVDECSLNPEIHVAFYRISQEALNNVVKHSRAQKGLIKLEYSNSLSHERKTGHNERVEMSVFDNGCGFNLDEVSSNHLGIAIMRERAQAIGAKLTINTQPGQGTQIHVRWENNDHQL
jgi:signal transduction histidine kinase/ligand-binding sensor domain-containing protein